jgi:hypothetical protein
MTTSFVTNASFRPENQSALEESPPDFVYQARILNPSSNEYASLRLQRNCSGDTVHFSIDRVSFSCNLTEVQTVAGSSSSSHLSITEFRGKVDSDSGRKERITIVVNCGIKPERLSINAEGGLGESKQLFWQITHDIQTGLIDFLTSCVKDATPLMAMQR